MRVVGTNGLPIVEYRPDHHAPEDFAGGRKIEPRRRRCPGCGGVWTLEDWPGRCPRCYPEDRHATANLPCGEVGRPAVAAAVQSDDGSESGHGRQDNAVLDVRGDVPQPTATCPRCQGRRNTFNGRCPRCDVRR